MGLISTINKLHPTIIPGKDHFYCDVVWPRCVTTPTWVRGGGESSEPTVQWGNRGRFNFAALVCSASCCRWEVETLPRKTNRDQCIGVVFNNFPVLWVVKIVTMGKVLLFFALCVLVVVVTAQSTMSVEEKLKNDPDLSQVIKRPLVSRSSTKKLRSRLFLRLFLRIFHVPCLEISKAAASPPRTALPAFSASDSPLSFRPLISEIITQLPSNCFTAFLLREISYFFAEATLAPS